VTDGNLPFTSPPRSTARTDLAPLPPKERGKLRKPSRNVGVRLTAHITTLLCLLLLAPRAFAQTPYSLQTHVSSREVEVGDGFSLQLSAMVEKGGDMPRSPQLRAPSGLAVHGPSVSTQQQISLSGGQFSQRVGVSATWTIVATRPGRYRIGPASIEIGGQRVSGDIVQVQVVPPGAGHQQPANPFDPFALRVPQLPGFGLEPDDDDNSGTPDVPPFPDELRVQHPADPIAFLRAVAKPTQAVVGEQITLDIYAYGRRGPFRETNTSEPSREAFLAQTILENSYSEQMYRVPIGSDVWMAKKIRELALFPIHAGVLSIGAMRMGFEGRGYPTSGQHLGLTRMSLPLEIIVTEPPEKGRPTGYKLGDVGRFTLSANVAPREITAGDSISVVAKLEGTGNLPFSLKTPQQRGVSWLDPTTIDQIEPHGTVIGGWRKFTYVVRLDEPGDVDLGELSLPYWDPERDSYDIASAKLGVIKVKPASGSAKPEPEQSDGLKDVIVLRKTLGPQASAREHLTDRSWFWLLVALTPLGVALTGQSVTYAGRLRRRLAEKRQSHATTASRALSDARSAADSGELAKTASAAERAVIAAIEGATGLKARAVLRAELRSELEKHGVAADLAERTAELLQQADDARFTGAASDTAANDLVERASAIVRALGRGKKNGGSNGA
jgi:BatD DUF11 like domain